ncbi:hypothetical protein TNIN_329041 [Trichonephila inaurata madagascariensis]|uniref:Uncharacterized protein n=1 Tax=Trichonephila inaurata madagascariensis TaxID=2747483 RepID=A0A8X6IKT6_9ARAC|nr:hypothetical protein TNIN_329041 [Trichonephila inaurata madagascariensis]
MSTGVHEMFDHAQPVARPPFCDRYYNDEKLYKTPLLVKEAGDKVSQPRIFRDVTNSGKAITKTHARTLGLYHEGDRLSQ